MTDSPPRWTRLSGASREHLEPGLDLPLALQAFLPLDQPPGWAAIAWLRRYVREQWVPMETHLAWDPSSTQILGFYVVRHAAFLLARGDRATEQPGAMLEFIARDRRTSPGFGARLVEHALGTAIDMGAVALLVYAGDEVAEKVWARHRFRPVNEPRDEESATMLLWHAVDEPRVGWSPS